MLYNGNRSIQSEEECSACVCGFGVCLAYFFVYFLEVLMEIRIS